MSHRAVAIDMGASSGRSALGELADGRISFQMHEQFIYEPVLKNDRLEWNIDSLLGLCRRAVTLAEESGATTVGIDSWGVDHGFIGKDGELMAAPVCYRDQSHVEVFETMAPHRRRLYELTGIQHQPFNTVCQLVARKRENPALPSEASGWLILPDLLGFLLGGDRRNELTQASTTQLMGLDSRWSEEAFEIAGWPVPDLQPTLPGVLAKEVGKGVRLASVGSHDTASAVAGFGRLADDQVFLNVGTWTLVGCVMDEPLATPEAESAGFTNERTVEGRVRFLKNIPGFYVINRLHKELKVQVGVPEWLRGAQRVGERIDLLSSALFNPDSMLEACRSLVPRPPETDQEWAGLALGSLAANIAAAVVELEGLTGRDFKELRVGGGGSQSSSFCDFLAHASKRAVIAGPAEVTVLGNLAAQFLAQGAFSGWDEAFKAVERSAEVKRFSVG